MSFCTNMKYIRSILMSLIISLIYNGCQKTVLTLISIVFQCWPVHKTRQDRTGQDRTGQDRAGQGKARQDKTRQDKTRH